MTHLWASAASLLGLALFLRLLLGRGQEETAWDARLEILRSLVLGVVFAICCAWVLSPIHAGVDPQLKGDLLVSSISADFQDYCGALGMYRDGVFEDAWPTKRSRGAALVSGELLRWFPVMDALSLGAIICAGLVGAGLYIWGRMLLGPVAGVATVLLACTMSPMPLLSRMLTFYPSITASLVLSSAFTVGAIRTRSPGWVLASGLGIGSCLLTDVRGLIWALPFFFTVLALVLIWPARKVKLGSRLGLVAILLLPLVAAWHVGSWAYPENADSLEEQADVRDLFELHGAMGEEFVGRNQLPSEYVWGRSSLLEIPTTLRFLLDQSQVKKPEEMREPSPGAHKAHLNPWVPIWAVCLVVSLVGLFRTRNRGWVLKNRELFLRLTALCVTLLPFAVALKGIFAIREMQVRFLTQVMPAMALLLGLAFVTVLRWPCQTLADGVVVRWFPRLERSVILDLTRGLLPLLLLGALVTGTIPSWWSPDADWRTSWKPNDPDLHHTAHLSERGGLTEGVRLHCFSAIQADKDAGWKGGLMGFEESKVSRFDLGGDRDDPTRAGNHKGEAMGPNSRGKLN